MRKSWSIRQLFNLVLLILLVPPSLLLGYSIYARQQEQRDAIQARSVTLARISADDAVSLIEDARYIVESLAKRPLVRTFDPNRCDPILRDLSQWHSEFASLSTIARSGEITESALIESHVNTMPLIRQLKNLGVSIALDDFGTGYSSLSYLATFPFDKIKIDRSFTQNMTKRIDCTAIILSVVALGYGLKIPTTAEGVETWEQFDLLRMSGVNFIQGCLFGQPCPMSQLEFTPARTGRPAAKVA